ncbi:MAG: hypothetical protein EOP45_17625 [Sphingobacteriaceae bacterium]|nr:MAG: hypothetical protein EOP45_17625 [Sphingobacteriaceae bacterium]
MHVSLYVSRLICSTNSRDRNDSEEFHTGEVSIQSWLSDPDKVMDQYEWKNYNNRYNTPMEVIDDYADMICLQIPLLHGCESRRRELNKHLNSD